MEKLALYARFVMAGSFMCLAAALVYFSHAMIVVVQELPKTLDKVQESSEVLQPILDQTGAIVTMLPQVLDESEKIREQVPAILSEVEQLRKLVPDVLKEVEAVRGELPAVLTEVAAVRTEVVPSVLKESAEVRTMVPPTLTRLEAMVDKANGMAKTAGEDAVTGFLTGIVKTPVNLLSSMGGKLIPESTGATDEDRKAIAALFRELANAGEIGVTKQMENAKTGFSAAVTIQQRVQQEGRDCYLVNVSSKKKRSEAQKRQYTTCEKDNGEWKIEPASK